MKPTKFSAALYNFEAYLDVEKNLSPRTRKAYVYDLERFADFLIGHGGASKSVGEIAIDDIKRYLEHLRMDRGLKSTTMSRTLSSIRAFFEYCVIQGYLEQSPALHIHRPKLPRKMPIYLIESELKRFLKAPAERAAHPPDATHGVDTAAAGIRDYAILVTFGFTGMRLSELIDLRVGDLDMESAMVRVLGKGAKERLLPLNETVVRALEAWLKVRKPADPVDEAVFLNRFGRRFSPRGVENLVDKYVRLAGIGKAGVSPHKLRHTFATLLHIHDTDILEIQALLGHSSITSTQIYTHTNPARLKSAVKKLENI